MTAPAQADLPEPGTLEYGNLAHSGSAPPLPDDLLDRGEPQPVPEITDRAEAEVEVEVDSAVWPPPSQPGRPLPLPGAPSALGLRKFRDRLPIPPLIRAWRRPEEAPLRIRAEVCRTRVHADLPEVDAWAYEGSLPGPTIEVLSGRAARIDWENRLGTAEQPAHLPFDVVRVPLLPPGGPFNADFFRAMQPGGRSISRGPGDDSYPPLEHTEQLVGATVVHLHGALTDGHNDGWAHNVTLPGGVTRCTYPNRQEAATLWYHDHAMAVTRFNVYAGLAGMYLIRDEQEARLRLPSGEREIPLVIADRNLETSIGADGKAAYTGRFLYKHAGFSFTPTGAVGEIPVTGPFTMVNGKIWPSLHAQPAWYRFRLVNATSSRILRLALHDTTDEVFEPGTSVGPTEPPFTANRVRDAIVVVGTDGGLLPAPVVVPEGVVEIGPGERLDFLVDLGRFRGRRLELRNENGTVLNAQPGQADATAMQIVVSRHGGTDRWRPPGTLSTAYRRYKHNDDGSLEIGGESIDSHDHAWIAVIPPGTRGGLHPELWELTEVGEHDPVPTADLIQVTRADGSVLSLHPVAKLFDDPTTVFIAHGRWAVWHILHLGGPDHPMHIHMTQFQMIARRQWPIDRPGGNVVGYDPATGSTTTPLPVAAPGRPIDPVGKGMKDTWVVKPGEWVSVLGEFSGATGSFMYHCHILDHEDHTMMRPFVVLPTELLAFHRGHGGGHH